MIRRDRLGELRSNVGVGGLVIIDFDLKPAPLSLSICSSLSLYLQEGAADRECGRNMKLVDLLLKYLLEHYSDSLFYMKHGHLRQKRSRTIDRK
jgi:hypothetical protein